MKIDDVKKIDKNAGKEAIKEIRELEKNKKTSFWKQVKYFVYGLAVVIYMPASVPAVVERYTNDYFYQVNVLWAILAAGLVIATPYIYILGKGALLGTVNGIKEALKGK